jgi:hypothetical protein
MLKRSSLTGLEELRSEGCYPSSLYNSELDENLDDNLLMFDSVASRLDKQQAQTSAPGTPSSSNAGATSSTVPSSMDGYGLAWDGRRGRWISLVYRYDFPSDSFISPTLPPKSMPRPVIQGSGFKGGGGFAFSPCKNHEIIMGQQSPFSRRLLKHRSGSRHRHHNPHRLLPRSQLSHIPEESSLPPSSDAIGLDDDIMVMQSEMPHDIFTSTSNLASSKSNLLLPDDDDQSSKLDDGPLDEWDHSLLSDFLSSAIMDDDRHQPFLSHQQRDRGCKQNAFRQTLPPFSEVEETNSLSTYAPPPSSPPPPLFLDGIYPIPDLFDE